MTKVLVVFNQKGGPGKTTVTMTLAGTLFHAGKKVVVVDSDKQASGLKWETRPIEAYPQHPVSVKPLVGLTKDQYVANMRKLLRDGYDYILIDTPPDLASPDLAHALFVADKGIIPFEPNILHQDAFEEVRVLLETVNEMRVSAGSEPLPVSLVINKLKPGRASQKYLADAAVQASGFPVLARLGDLAGFESASNFRTTLEAVCRPSDKARQAAKNLANAVEEYLA
jgi:chromosome partitioning protein